MNISIDLDTEKFIGFNEHEMNMEIEKYKKIGIGNFDVFFDVFLKEQLVEYKHTLLKKLKENDIKISFHSLPIDGCYTTFKDKEYMLESLKTHADFLKKLRADLSVNGIDYSTTIVYHSSDYVDECDKQKQMELIIEFYNKLAEVGKQYKFDILAETLSQCHPLGNHIGNCFYDIECLCNNISHPNFGICWDMGHTHLNFLECDMDKIPSKNILNRIKFTHIHDWRLGVHTHHVNDKEHLSSSDKMYIKLAQDHLPLLNKAFQEEEINALKKNGYIGFYSIEVGHGEFLRKNHMHEKDIIKSLEILKEIVCNKMEPM